jgi:hypothetical protein
MKKRLLILVFAIGMMGLTQSKAAISAFCFTDAFGYVANVTATKTAPGHWELSGTGNVLTGYDWLFLVLMTKKLTFGLLPSPTLYLMVAHFM